MIILWSRWSYNQYHLNKVNIHVQNTLNLPFLKSKNTASNSQLKFSQLRIFLTFFQFKLNNQHIYLATLIYTSAPLGGVNAYMFYSVFFVVRHDSE